MRRHVHWIAGVPRASRVGLVRLCSRRPGDGSSLGEWARSGPAELELALATLGAGGQPVGAELVAGVLERVGRRLQSAGGDAPLTEGLGALEARLGAPPGSLVCEQLALPRRRPAVPRPGPDRSGRGRVTVLVAHWTHAVGELVALVLGEVEAGRRVLLLADPELPMGAELAAQLLLEAGLPASELAVLFDLVPGAWPSLAQADVAWQGRLGPGRREELAALGSREPALGEVLEGLPGPAARTWDLVTRARELGLALPELPGQRSPELEVLADDLLGAAFGLDRALGGLGHGASLLASAPAVPYAAFVGTLLERFESPGLPGDRAVSQGVESLPSLGASARATGERYTARWRGLVDRGAAILAGGRWSRSGAGAQLAPSLLVNVDPAELSAAPAEPLAVLGIVRLSGT